MPTILVSGANRGLGLEFVRQYAADGWTVHACCRNPDGAGELNAIATAKTSAAANGNVTVHKLDVADFAAIDRLAKTLDGEPIDVLLNNAGVGGGDRQEFMNDDFEAWSRTFRVNTMAPLRMTEVFVDNVAASGRKVVVIMSTIMASMTEEVSGKLHLYRTSKAAVNMVMRLLSVDLAERGITTFSLHPGWVRTDMGGAQATLSPEESIAGIRQVIAGAGPETNGRFMAWNGKELPW